MRWSQRSAVGILGLGIIGSRVAAVLRSKEFRVYVWNRSPKEEPNFLGSPEEVARSADVIQVFVSDEAALSQTLDALVPALGKNHTVLLHPTISPETVRAAAQRIAATGASVLDAPFTGSRGAAEQGALVYFIGGEAATLNRVRTILAASSREIVPLGKVGDAAIFKVATNLITAATVQALTEALALVRRAGADPALLEKALAFNAARSGAVDLKLPKILSEDFTPHFSLRNMAKDMRIATTMATAGAPDLPLLQLIRAKLDAGIDAGWGEEDFAVLARNDASPTPSPAPDAAAG